MKLKLFVFGIFVALGLVGYTKYHEYSVLKNISSFEECEIAKGSIIQESFPPTCVTKLGNSFSAKRTSKTNQKVTSFESPYAKLSLTFAKPYFVYEEYSNEGYYKHGEIIVSSDGTENSEKEGLHILYGKPFLDGKGGGCVDENGEGANKKSMILNQTVDICDVGGWYTVEYPKHDKFDIDYWFYIISEKSSQDRQILIDSITTSKFTY